MVKGGNMIGTIKTYLHFKTSSESYNDIFVTTEMNSEGIKTYPRMSDTYYRNTLRWETDNEETERLELSAMDHIHVCRNYVG